MLYISVTARYEGRELKLKLREVKDMVELMDAYKEVEFDYRLEDCKGVVFTEDPEGKLTELVYPEPNENMCKYMDNGYGLEYVPSGRYLLKEIKTDGEIIAKVKINIRDYKWFEGMYAVASVETLDNNLRTTVFMQDKENLDEFLYILDHLEFLKYLLHEKKLDKVLDKIKKPNYIRRK